MLLLIAVANVHLYLHDRPVGVRGYPAELSGIDRWVALVQLSVVDGRAYPLFGLLFGYGVVQLVQRQTDTGVPQRTAVGLLRRRGAWTLLLGLLHATLLWSGDFLGLYGLLALLAAGLLVRVRDRTLVAVAGVGLLATALFFAGSAFPPPPGTAALLPSVAEPDLLAAAAARLTEWSIGFVNGIGLFGAVALGALAARHRLLDEPRRHLSTLRTLAWWGTAVGVLSGVPMGALAAGLFPDASLVVRLVVGALHAAGGFAGGVGLAALFGVLATRLDRDGPVTRGLVACGQRSLSCYLAQSLFFVALLPAWTLGGGRVATLAEVTVVGIAVWLAVLGCAAGAERARGPAERLLRRLTYGRRSGPRAAAARSGAPAPEDVQR